MIRVEEAIAIIHHNSLPTNSFETIEIAKANGYILYSDVISPINMPPFRQSAVDGYAISIHDKTTYNVIDEIKAGDHHRPTLKKGEAVRIFTGAPVPDSANAVIMQEKVNIDKHIVTIESLISLNENIRSLAEQVTKGEIALQKSTLLTPAAIGFIISLGVTEVTVYSKPSIAIVVTGNELAEAGKDLVYGQIYESNAVMLTAALKSLNFQNVSTYKVADNYQETVNVLRNVIATHDLVLVSGGISVGDYDFVGTALEELNVEQLFYKVKQKPGKPLFFGKKENKMVFALPGNPAAALSCFYIYVYPALQRMSGNSTFSLTKVKAQSESNIPTPGDRAQFLKAIYHNGTVEILEGQNSSMLHTFAVSNAIVFVPEEVDSIKINDDVEVILLPIN
jgi:molybdopterin molybdotransferase